ncbi:MAG: MoxR family ATPase [Bacteroidota bacterium]|nr:MoxR family ATPase [Bacteroidota bacterium]
MDEIVFRQRTDLSQLNEAVAQIRDTVGNVIKGQQQMVDLIIAALLSDGHILVEGVPGVAKTLTAKLVARIIDAGFSRLQFTPDLMPSDVLGTSVFNPKELRFEFKKGPIFSHIVLIDEINRSPAKTQAALFEVMEERQVTVDGHTYPMEAPFIVMATQNPIEQEGTYRLPEAQLDRFIFKIEVGYPTLADEISLLTEQHNRSSLQLLDNVPRIINREEVAHYRNLVLQITVEQRLLEFIARIVHETRNNSSLYLGASPRASLAIVKAAKAFAAIRGRDFVTPEDIVDVVPHVLRHRIILTPEKEMEGLTPDELIQKIIKSAEIPR